MNTVEQAQSAPAKIVVSTILLSKPGIIVSVAFTGFAGLVLANRGLPSVFLIVLTLVSLLLSAAGSAILNNVLDQQIDTLMNRLSKRVDALEAVGVKTAVAIALVFLVISLFISFYYINVVNALLTIAAFLSYTLLYTLYLKRSSPYGTILGGLPGALPVLIGYAAVNPAIGPEGYILFIFMMLWQPPHFWALAQKYKLDYKKSGCSRYARCARDKVHEHHDTPIFHCLTASHAVTVDTRLRYYILRHFRYNLGRVL